MGRRIASHRASEARTLAHVRTIQSPRAGACPALRSRGIILLTRCWPASRHACLQRAVVFTVLRVLLSVARGLEIHHRFSNREKKTAFSPSPFLPFTTALSKIDASSAIRVPQRNNFYSLGSFFFPAAWFKFTLKQRKKP
jgi:hypothetical protein